METRQCYAGRKRRSLTVRRQRYWIDSDSTALRVDVTRSPSYLFIGIL